MKLEWLDAVSKVEKFGSFCEAAENIPCAQSSVSRYVKSAEYELGVRLFKRSSNSNTVELTEEGKTALPAIEKILEDYADLCKKIKKDAPGHPAPLSLGIMATTFSSLSKGDLMSYLYLKHPEILLTIEELPVDSHIEQLVKKNVDVVLVFQPFWNGQTDTELTNNSLIHCIPLGAQRLSIAFGEKYAPKDRVGITFAELKNERFIFHTDIRKTALGSEFSQNRHSMFLTACRNSGFEPEIVLVDRHLADIKQTLAVSGKGVFPSTIPCFLREYPGIKYLPVLDAPYYVGLFLLSLKSNKNKTIDVFAQFLKESFDRAKK